MADSSAAESRTLGRYALFGEIASGGMATVHLARLLGSVGFARTVAIKRLHPHLAKDPEFVAMFLEEARLAARVRHPNVVATLDVVSEEGELFLVMEYVAGESLSRLVRKTREAGKRIPPRYVVAMICSALDGLHAAHDATSERGVPLGIVHRDVSPQNIHVGLDGVARVLDFGIAKATNRVQETRTDQIKGKVAYMSPEQLAKGPIDRRADVYSACVVLWEALTGQRLFKADDVPALVYSIMNDEVHPPSKIVPDLPLGMDAIVMKGLDRSAENRWGSARELAVALERVLSPAAPRDIGEWVEQTGGDALAWRIELVQRIESETSQSLPPGVLRAAKDPSDAPIEAIEASGVVRNLAEPEMLRRLAAIAPESSDATTQELLPSDDDDRASANNAAQASSPPGKTASKSVSLAPQARQQSVRPAAALAGIAERSRKRTMRLGAIVAGGLVLLVLSAVIAFRVVSSNKPDPDPASSSSASGSSSVDEQAISLGAATRNSAPAVSSSAPPIAAAPPSTTPPPATQPPPPPPRPKNDCDTPFTVDAKGNKHPKPHCFKR